MAVKKPEQELAEQWRDLLALHARTQCELDRALHQHGLCGSDFEVLDVLADGGCDYRVQEISERVHLSQSALSRLIGRLEAEGLVHRAMCTNDRRGIFAHLTDEGRARWKAAQPTHRSVLAEELPANAPAPAPAAS